MHCRVRFLVPPEARLPAEPTASSLSDEPPAWTATERLTLVSLLTVKASVIAYVLAPPLQNISAPIAPLVILSTTLVTYTFWRKGRGVSDLRAALSYCLSAGVLAGIANVWLCIVLMTLASSGELVSFLDPALAGMLTLLAAVAGVAFGVACLLPMLTRLSARELRPAEGIDRCLIGFGFWGTLVLGSVLAAWSPHAKPHAGPHHPMAVAAVATLGAHALMFLVGLGRSARRQWWLARVRQGKVPGWLACDRERFVPGELEGLEMFCEPWLGREHAGGPRVLALGTATRASDVYRECPPVPKFLIGE